MKILSATYGAENCQLDVTDQLQRLVDSGCLDFTVTNELFSDPCPNLLKTLRFRYEIEGTPIEHVREAPEGGIVSEPEAKMASASSRIEAAENADDGQEDKSSLSILHATWGSGDCQIDVTERLQSLVNGGRLLFTATNQLFTDPCVNHIKTVKFSYRIGRSSTEHVCEVQEGGFVSEPVTDTKNVGIFYTNLSVPEKYLDRVLKQLAKSMDKVDIITCPWKPIKGNPFPELPWQYHISNHLTINLQILKLLYTAQEVGRYEYVFFLEHDVLYPEGYFEIEPFEVDVLSNANYIGLSEEGFQLSHPAHEPLHQLAMRLPAAIEHFEGKLSKALTHGGIILEPNGRSWARRQSSQPAVHINHGGHFTSHYAIYSKDKVEASHPYWGSAGSWWS